MLGERLRKMVEDSSVTYMEKILKVTISVGIAQLEPEDASGATLIARADASLYEAKRKGRNRVEIG